MMAPISTMLLSSLLLLTALQGSMYVMGPP